MSIDKGQTPNQPTNNPPDAETSARAAASSPSNLDHAEATSLLWVGLGLVICYYAVSTVWSLLLGVASPELAPPSPNETAGSGAFGGHAAGIATAEPPVGDPGMNAEAWTPFLCEMGGFEVSLPADSTPTRSIVEWRTPYGAVREVRFTVEPGQNRRFVAGYADFPVDQKLVESREAQNLLTAFSDNFVRELVEKVAFRRFRNFGPAPGLDLMFGDERGARGRARYLLMPEGVSFIAVSGPSRDALRFASSDAFFHSLRLNRGRGRFFQEGDEPMLENGDRLRAAAGRRMGISSGMLRFQRNLERITGDAEHTMLFTSDDPTIFYWSDEERNQWNRICLDREEAELNDPSTSPARKAQIQYNRRRGVELMQQAESVSEGIRAGVAQSQRDLLERNQRYEGQRQASEELIHAEAVQRAAEESIWRAEEDINFSRIAR